jgi:hypothetical protein
LIDDVGHVIAARLDEELREEIAECGDIIHRGRGSFAE